ncbi:MAG TPA: rubredoxin [Thermodesulfovibrionales bacterium]|nr:rubredoxin [Thermodesulfovibrionales bacterium]
METELEKSEVLYVCGQCGYIYNPAKGDRKGNVPSSTAFEDLSDEWTCPLCGAKKTRFSPML